MYYSAHSGSFTVTATATDTLSRLNTLTFPDTVGSGQDYAFDGQTTALQSYGYVFTEQSTFSQTTAVTATDRAGNETTQPFSVLRDTTPPVITLTVPAKSGLAIPVAWPAHDGLSGLRHYTVQVKEEGSLAGWTDWLTETTATHSTFVGSKGVTYTFQVKAWDNVDNDTGWVQSGPVFVGASVKKYYTFNGQRIAMRQGDEVYYFTGDHLGSVSLTTDSAGNVIDERRYLPYGEERWSSGAAMTDFGFTGQRHDRYIKLYDYGARWYVRR